MSEEEHVRQSMAGTHLYDPMCGYCASGEIERLRAALEPVGRVLAAYHEGRMDSLAMRDMGLAFDDLFPTYWDDRRAAPAPSDDDRGRGHAVRPSRHPVGLDADRQGLHRRWADGHAKPCRLPAGDPERAAHPHPASPSSRSPASLEHAPPADAPEAAQGLTPAPATYEGPGIVRGLSMCAA